MATINPNTCPADDKLLTAALGGGSAMTVAAHAATCPDCGPLWETFRAAASSARPTRRDADCLDDNALAEYIEGVITPGPRRHAEAHLAACAACTAQLAALHGLLEPGARESVPQIALAWLRDGLRTLDTIAAAFRPVELSLAPVLRDATGDAQLAWEFDSPSGPVRVVVQHESGQGATLRITPPVHAEAPRCRVLLWSGGDLLEARTLHQGGVAEFADLALERHEVTVEIGDTDLRFDVDLQPGDLQAPDPSE